MNLLTNNKAEYKAVRTLLQSFIGFIVGFILVIWNTPGVPQNIQNYLQPYEMNLLVWIGVPTVFISAIIAYIPAKLNEKQTSPVIEAPSEPIAESGTPQA